MESAAEPSQELVEHCWKRRNKIVYQARVSALYHLKRERFFQSNDKLITFLTAVAATSAVGFVLKKVEWLDVGVGVVTAVLALVPAVYNPADLARRHGQAAAEFRRLLADAERAGEHWTVDLCDEFSARILDLEAVEPAALSALVIVCENHLKIAAGNSAARVRLNWCESLFKQWYDFDAARIADRHQRETSQHAMPATK